MTKAEIIEAVLQAPPDRADAILDAARGTDTPRPGTDREAAAILRCHPRTVKRYARRGLLREIRIGTRRVRYDLRAVELLANGLSNLQGGAQ